MWLSRVLQQMVFYLMPITKYDQMKAKGFLMKPHPHHHIAQNKTNKIKQDIEG